MAEKDKAAKKAAAAPGKPEPHDTTTTAGEVVGKSGITDAEAVQEQREQEAEAQVKVAEERGTDGSASRSEKGQQTRAAKPVQEQAAADAEARAEASEGGGDGTQGTERPEPNLGDNDPVQTQRDEEAKAKVEAATGEEVSEEDARLLGAAPGGQRTAMTDGKEGSTTVSNTAASPRPSGPLAGPLSSPLRDVENFAASEDDVDNRVYADEAGPREVFEDTETPEAEFIDADGNGLSYDEMFEDDGTKTFVTAKVRVYERFIFPNTTTEGRRLAYAAGRRVPRGEAENVKNRISQHVRFV